MMIAFQVILFILIVLFSLGLLGIDTKENKQCYASVVIASVIAQVVCFYIGS
jgi:hypothetical protein